MPNQHDSQPWTHSRRRQSLDLGSYFGADLRGYFRSI
jgi:hypothetical protein